MEEAPTIVANPAASTPVHFQANVARCHSRNPVRVACSSAVKGGSGRPRPSSPPMSLEVSANYAGLLERLESTVALWLSSEPAPQKGD